MTVNDQLFPYVPTAKVVHISADRRRTVFGNCALPAHPGDATNDQTFSLRRIGALAMSEAETELIARKRTQGRFETAVRTVQPCIPTPRSNGCPVLRRHYVWRSPSPSDRVRQLAIAGSIAATASSAALRESMRQP